MVKQTFIVTPQRLPLSSATSVVRCIVTMALVVVPLASSSRACPPSICEDNPCAAICPDRCDYAVCPDTACDAECVTGDNDCNANNVPDVCDDDTDSDGHIDDCDNCPNIHNPDQADGNGDGTGDVCDTSLSHVVYTLELGGDNHADQYEAGTDFPPFAPGSTSDGQVYTIGDVVTWGVRVHVFGTHNDPYGRGHGFKSNGAAGLAFDLELHEGTSEGSLANITAGSATSQGWFSSINDGDADGVRGSTYGADPLQNAAFASSFDLDGNGHLGGRVSDGRIAGGPTMSYAKYPTASGRPAATTVQPGVLAGMGAAYPIYNHLTHTPGVGMTEPTASGAPGLGELVLFEGQINTTGITAGTYVLVIKPAGGNALRGDFDAAAESPGREIVSVNRAEEDVVKFSLQVAP